MKLFLMLFNMLASLFQHPYAKKLEYAEYWAYWGTKINAKRTEGWAVVAFILALASVVSMPHLALLSNVFLAVSVVITLVTLPYYDKLLGEVFFRKKTPGVLTILAVAVGVVVGLSALLAQSPRPPYMFQAATMLWVVISSFLLLQIGEPMFDEAWEEKLRTVPRNGYIDCDGTYRRTDDN